jgi:hypothetical protein
MMRGDGGVDEVATKSAAQARQSAVLVRPREPAVATTSATKIAASLRVLLIPPPAPPCAIRRTRPKDSACAPSSTWQ